MSLSNPTRPGAMSLLDKYAALNQNIDQTRRRITSTRTVLESTNQSIENLRDDRTTMEDAIAAANDEIAAFREELKRVKAEWDDKMQEKQRVESEHRLAVRECADAKRQIDSERLAFLERCREFRSSCKRMRAAATIFVLEGGFDEGEGDVWRMLKEQDLEDEGDGIGPKRKKCDVEMERAVKEEKKYREAFIEAECALHSARSERDKAVERCNTRNQKLTQQRAQLDRHRREVEELEKEVGRVKDEIVKVNQDAKNYENAWKRVQSNSNTFNSYKYNRNTSNSGSFSSHFNPPTENNNIRTPLYNSSNTGGNAVQNPYKSKPSNPYVNRSGNQDNNQGRPNGSSCHYASEILRDESNDPGGSTHQNQGSLSQPSYGSSNQNRSRSSARNQRQFGTAVDISVDYYASTSPNLNSAKTNRVSLNTPITSGGTDESSVSSSSSGEDMISFEIFGNKKRG